MAKVNKKQRFKGTYVVLIVSILALNFVGISYAHWNNNLEIAAKISTCKFKPRFANDWNNDSHGNGNLRVNITNNKATSVISVTGDVEHDYRWGNLQYGIENESGVPIKAILINEDTQNIVEEIEISRDAENNNLVVPLGANFNYKIICRQSID